MTIPELLRKTYEFDYECNRFLDSSYNRKLYTVGIFERSNLANIPIEEITKDDLNRFLAGITDYSNSTIAKIYVCLKESFVLAELDGIIDENPFDNIRAFRLPKSNKPDKKVSAFTVDEEKAFLNALNDEYTCPTHGNWYRHQFLIALHTGMRMGEINAFTIKDLGFSNKLIYVTKTISTSGNGYQPYLSDNTKTESVTRIIPMNELAEKYLKQSVDNYIPNRGELLFFNYKRNTYITTNKV
jgi:integrase